MIPVVMEPRCLDQDTWHGTVGLMLGHHLYIDLSSESPSDFNRNIQKLVQEIRKRVRL